MKGYIAFTKKEFLEQIRTYKTFILLTVFFIFGMASPLLAKLLPDIISSMSIDGMKITIAEPTAIDAYTQFFKNTTQMGIIVVLLVFSGCISGEISKGTLINMLSKGLSRQAVILSKFTASIALWTVSYALAVVTNYGYTIYLFGNQPVEHLLFSCFCLWLFGAFILAVILAAGTLTKGNYGALLVTAVILGILLMLNMFPKSMKFNPVSLASNNVAILTNSVKMGNMGIAVGITILATILCLIAALLAFRKKKL